MPRQKKQHLKQRKDGRFCCKYHGLQFMGATEEEALRARDDYKRREAAGLLSPPSPYFSAYALKWLSAYKSHLTRAPYNTHVRMCNRFVALLGDRPIADYTPSDVSLFYQQFSGKSISLIHSARDTVRGVFRAALADQLIPRDPTYNLALPRGTHGTHRAITDEERSLIHATDHRLRPAVMLMLYAGLRKGEALALNVKRDVDFENKLIHVREAVRFAASGRPLIVDPKTEAGARTIPLMDILAEELKPITGLVCRSASGEMMTESAFKRAWDSYLVALSEKKNGCSRRWAKRPYILVTLRAHDLRHSYCTMLYNAGIDLKTAMLWMGHADQKMTMQIYTHLTESRQSAAVEALQNAEKTLFRMQNGMQSESPAP